VNFLVDAHLPPSLAEVLRTMGHDVVHTRDLPARNQTRDSAINELSLRDQRIVITKDTDFFYSHVLNGRPWKLILVRTGNIGTRDLRQLFERHLAVITAALQTHTLIEIDRQAVTPVQIS
jgi:predicted nuclease of predicted toxin-antitoxin system